MMTLYIFDLAYLDSIPHVALFLTNLSAWYKVQSVIDKKIV
jgi:hypothetical protein